jgi:predicted nucleic acid-binding protein
MEIITDASVLVAVIVNEGRRQSLILSSRGADLIAPASVHWEIGNALSAMLKRGRIMPEQVAKAIAAYERIPLRYVDVELDQSLSVAAELDIYAYDAYLLRCALKYRAPLLTLDRGLIHVAKQMNIETVEVV